jgi:hypothetical protein
MENFNLKKFLVENKLTANSKLIKENVEVEEVTLGGTRFAVEEQDPLDDGIIISITKHKNGYFITGEVQDDDGDVKEGYGYAVDFEGNKLEDIYDPEDLDENKSIDNTKKVNEEMDFESSSQIQAVINYLIDNDHQDVLDMLGKIPEWNELVTQAADY